MKKNRLELLLYLTSFNETSTSRRNKTHMERYVLVVHCFNTGEGGYSSIIKDKDNMLMMMLWRGMRRGHEREMMEQSCCIYKSCLMNNNTGEIRDFRYFVFSYFYLFEIFLLKICP